MGNKNDYLSLEESARLLGRPVSFLKNVLSEGKLSAKLAGGRWLVSVRDLERLRQTLSSEAGRVARDFDAVGTPPRPGRASRPSNGSSTGAEAVGTGDAASRAEYLKVLDARVRDLADQIEVELAYLVNRRVVWDKLRADNFDLSRALRAQLPNSVVRLLESLRSTKQEYIVLRQTSRYKGLLKALPEYDYERVAQVVGVRQQKPDMAPPVSKPIGGIDGYFDGRVTEKHHRERGDPPPVPPAQEGRLAILRSKERAAARSMRDRGKSREARKAAEATWAQTRREAESMERRFQGAWEPVGGPETKRTGGMGRPASSKSKKEASHPASRGNPTSGIVLVVEQPVGPRVLDALRRSLRAVSLPGAYVTNTSIGLLKDELLAAQPRALVAIGGGAARYIDAAGYSLVRQPFSEAEPGVWFSWTGGISGLLLPSLAPALDDEAAKRRFWRAFLVLKTITPTADHM